MKKILSLFIALLFSYTAFAQVAFLLRTDNINALPEENFNSEDQQPERNAANWFKDTYSANSKTMLTIARVKDGDLLSAGGAPAYKVLWVNVDAVGLANLAAAGIDEAVINAIKAYVQAGGNLLLTKQATKIVADIDRMGVRTGGNSKLEPSWPVRNMENYTTSGQIAVQPLLGSANNTPDRDARQHPIYAGMSNYNLADGTHLTYETNSNYSWIELDRKNGSQRAGNTNIDQLNFFQSDWACSILAVQGNIGDFCLPVIMEFHPTETYKGTILMIGSAGYQWGSSNNALDNVKLLTCNALNYLAAGGDEYGYYMPYTLSENYSREEYRPDFEAAIWFYDNYVVYNKGRFIHKEQDIPTSMKVLWVNNDRINQNRDTYYDSEIGGDALVTKLNSFVSTGGQLYLSKQACYLAYKLNKIYNPSWSEGGYVDSNNDAWPINASNIGRNVQEAEITNRSSHPIYQYMTTSEANTFTYNDGAEQIPYETFLLCDKNRRTDNNYIWAEMDHDRNGNHLGNTDKNKLSDFESAWNCKVLAVWGHVMDYCGAGLLEFTPTASEGTIIANGFAAYQWTTTNNAIDNVKNLTKGILSYLYSLNVYTREVTAGQYGTICLPRKMETISDGMTLYRVLSDVGDGIMLEEILPDETNAGEPYFFYSTASEIRVTMTGSAVLSPIGGNGLIGNFGPASITVTKNDDNYILAAPGGTTGLYFVDSDDVTIGANRAYLKRLAINTNDIGSAPGRTVRKMSIRSTPNTATGLEAPEEDTLQPIKKLVNGHLYIQYGDKVYDITGNQIQ